MKRLMESGVCFVEGKRVVKRWESSALLRQRGAWQIRKDCCSGVRVSWVDVFKGEYSGGMVRFDGFWPGDGVVKRD